MAIEFLGASLSWDADCQPLSARGPRQRLGPVAVGGDGRRGGAVLRDIDLSVPAGKLTVVYGEVGSGQFFVLAHDRVYAYLICWTASK